MSIRKRFLFLGCVSIFLASFLFFVSSQAPVAHAAAINGCPPTQTENSGSNNTSWVQVIQYVLNAEGHYGSDGRAGSFTFPNWPLAIDGSFGSKTYTAVVDFQKWAGISSDGQVGPQTWAEMGFCYNGSYTSPRYLDGLYSNETCPPTQSENGSINNAVLVEAIQDTLNVLYFKIPGYTTSPKSWTPYLTSDGSFGAQTYAAVYDWTAYFGPTATGVVNAQTWLSLDMCY
jgi:peptidoglycan hydrolase-like protein with peptidoglycan-binding domain